MSASYQTIQLKAQAFVTQANSKLLLKPDQWQKAISQAAQHFSGDMPRLVKADITPTGAYEYKLTNPSGVASWDNDFSYLAINEAVEFPANQQVPVYMETDRFTVYEKANGDRYLRFLNTSPTAPDVIRVKYAIPHSVMEASSTIPNAQEHLIVFLVCHYACLMLHAEFLQSRQSNLQSDTLDDTERGSKYQSLAEYYLKRYADLLDGTTEESSPFGFGQKDMDIEPGYGDTDFLVHTKGNR